MYLHENPNEMAQLIAATAEFFSRAEAYIEKDYYAMMVLREAVSRNPRFVFKGGTCLSKCYHAIERFSEDVDLGLAGAEFRRQSRHIYDLRKLQEFVEFDDGLAQLFSTVRKQRFGKSRCLSADSAIDLAATIQELAEKDVYKRDYHETTVDLLYDEMPYEEAVKALLAISAFVKGIDWNE
ncbi:MAG: nucleotidyl transferase AbiEii/AbiGii toxin family protein [Eggerthellaceae bacterium]|nr:nucleotidyl transferase AbiEii/AbiGii toxin family protein [Eggerthellaceae bacterium]